MVMLVDVDGVGVVEFPDNTSQQDVERIVQEQIYPQAGIEIDQPGFGAAFSAGVDILQGGLYSTVEGAGEAVGLRTLAEWGKEGAARNKEEAAASLPQSQDFESADSAGEYWRWFKHTLGTSTAISAPMIAGGAIGALLGPPGIIAGTAVGAAVGAVVGTPVYYGLNRERQKEEHGAVIDEGMAFAVAPLQGALDALLGRVLPGGASRGLAINILAKIGIGAATEFPTEVAQTVLERAQAGLPLDDDNAMREYKEAAAGAIVAGGTIAGISGIATRKTDIESAPGVREPTPVEVQTGEGLGGSGDRPTEDVALSTIISSTQQPLEAFAERDLERRTAQAVDRVAPKDVSEEDLSSLRAIAEATKAEPLSDPATLETDPVQAASAPTLPVIEELARDKNLRIKTPRGAFTERFKAFAERKVGSRNIGALTAGQRAALYNEIEAFPSLGVEAELPFVNMPSYAVESYRRAEEFAINTGSIKESDIRRVGAVPDEEGKPVQLAPKIAKEILKDLTDNRVIRRVGDRNLLRGALRRTAPDPVQQEAPEPEQLGLPLGPAVGEQLTLDLQARNAPPVEEVVPPAPVAAEPAAESVTPPEVVSPVRGAGIPAEAVPRVMDTIAPAMQEQAKQRGLPQLGVKSKLVGNIKKAFGDPSLPDDLEGINIPATESTPKTIALAWDAVPSDATTDQEIIEYLSGVLDHETIHALIDAGVITDAQWKQLYRYAQNNKEPGTTDTYFRNAQVRSTQDALAEAERQGVEATKDFVNQYVGEEAVAQAFRAFAADPKNVAPPVRNIFQKIIDTLKGLVAAFRSNGFQSADEIFRQIASGEAVAQAQTEGRVAEGTNAPVRYSRRINTPEFKGWFGNSEIVNEDGTPRKMYHGTKREFEEFEARFPDGLFFFTFDPKFAGDWARGREASDDTKAIAEEMRQWKNEEFDRQIRARGESYDALSEEDKTVAYDAANAAFAEKYKPYTSPYDFESEADIRVLPLYLSVQKLFDPRRDYALVEPTLLKIGRGMDKIIKAGQHKVGNWVVYENEPVISKLKELGYDGLLIRESAFEGPHDTVAIWDAKKVKSALNDFAPGASTSKRFSRRTDTPEFKKWWRGSKVVDENGKPLPVYHSTSSTAGLINEAGEINKENLGQPFNEFRPFAHFGTQRQSSQVLKAHDAPSGIDVMMTLGIPPGKQAEWWKGLEGGERDRLFKDYRRDYTYRENARSIPVYLSIQNPLRVIDDGQGGDTSVMIQWAQKAGALTQNEASTIQTGSQLTKVLNEKGYDGFVYLNRREGVSVTPEYGDAALTDEQFLEKYPDAKDSWVAFQPTQIKSVFNDFAPGASTSKRFSRRGDGSVVKTEPQPVFYSELTRTAENAKQNKAPAAQWLGMLKNTPGVSPTEIEATGLEDWLAEQSGSITKEQLVNHLRENEVVVEEILKTENDLDRDDLEKMWVEQIMEGGDYDVWYDAEESGWAYGLYGEPTYDFAGTPFTYPSEARAKEGLTYMLQDEAGTFSDDELKYQVLGDERADIEGGPVQYATWQLPKGENYKELLLTLPHVPRSEVRPTASASAPYMEDWDRVSSEIRATRAKLDQARLDMSPEYSTIMDMVRALELRRSDLHDKMVDATIAQSGGRLGADPYYSTHYDEANIIAHIRFNERMEDNKKILFIEEIQSDWNQDASKMRKEEIKRLKDAGNSDEEVERLVPSNYGYLPTKKDLAALETAGREYKNYLGSLQEKYDDQIIEGAQLLEVVTPEETSRLYALNETMLGLQRMTTDTYRAEAFPANPFQSTEAWAGLAFKRMVRYAVENDFNEIAWTTGDQQVERYRRSLRNQVDKIQWKKTPEGVHIKGLKKSIYGTGISQEELGPITDAFRRANISLDYHGLDHQRTYSLREWEGTATIDPDTLVPELKAMWDRVNGDQYSTVVDTTEKETNLSNALGEAMADQIKNDPSQTGVISGDRITISDTGMSGFYDQIMRAYVNGKKLPKKWKARAGTRKITLTDPVVLKEGRNRTLADVAADVDRTPEELTELIQSGVGAEEIGLELPDFNLAVDEVNANKEETTVHNMPITEPMQEVMGGQKRFSRRVRKSKEGLPARDPRFNGPLGKQQQYEVELRRPGKKSITRVMYATSENDARGKIYNNASAMKGVSEIGRVRLRPGAGKFARPPLGQRVPRATAVQGRSVHDNFVRSRTTGFIDRILHSDKPLFGGNTSMVDLRIKLQDKMLPIGMLQDAILENGGIIDDNFNTYMVEQLSHGKTVNEIRENEDALYLPLLRRLKTRPSGVTQIDLENFLVARHAESRNRVLRGRMTPEVLAQRTEPPSGMEDQEARDHIAKFRRDGKEPELLRLADMAYKIIENTNQIRLANGLIDPSMLNQSWDYYVPLRGETESESDAGYDFGGLRLATKTDRALGPRTGKKGGIRGKEDKSATGRHTASSDTLAHIFQQNEEAIIRANRNQVIKSFADLIRANKDMLGETAQILGSYPTQVVTNKTTHMLELKPNMVATQTPDVVAFKEINPRTGKVRETHIKTRDVRLAMALNGLSSPDNNGMLVTGLAKMNRWLANVNTSWNPEFIISNFLKDIQTAGIVAAQYDVEGLSGRMIRSVPHALKGIEHVLRSQTSASVEGSKSFLGKKKLFGRDAAPLSPQAQEYADAFRRLQKLGGTTEFLGIKDLNTTLQRIEKELKEAGSTGGAVFKNSKNFMKSLGELVEDYNKVAENAIRLTAFHELTKGPNPITSDMKGAMVAKNLTVNFNKGGTSKAFANSMYLFYNASLQGTWVLMNAMKSKRVQKIAAGIVMAGMVQDTVNSILGFDDDDDGMKDYDEIDEWVKEHNIIFTLPDGMRIQLPMPYGFNSFFNMGRALSAMTRGAPNATPTKTAESILFSFLDSFNPLGGSNNLVNWVAPTVLDPMIDLYANRDFAGRPIKPERVKSGSRPVEPDSQLFWNNTSPPFVGVADFLNRLTGGNEFRPGKFDVSPNQLEHVFDYALGATGTFAVRTYSTLVTEPLKVLQSDFENVDLNSVVFLRKIIGNTGNIQDQRQFYTNAEDVLLAQKEYEGFLKAGDIENAMATREKYSKQLQIAGFIKSVDGNLSKLRQRLKTVRANPYISDTVRETLEKQIKDQQDMYVDQANRMYNQTVRNAP